MLQMDQLNTAAPSHYLKHGNELVKSYYYLELFPVSAKRLAE
jgi:hypothetical protein